MSRTPIGNALAVALSAALLTSCQGATTSGLSADDIPHDLDRMAAQPHGFTEVLRIAGRTWSIDGVVADDYRYRARVSVDGVLAYEEVDLDDVRYLKVADPTLVLDPRNVDQLRQGVAPVRALLSGRWVRDPAGAPSDLVSGESSVLPLDPSLVLSAVHAADDVRGRLRGLQEWNPDAVYYLPKDDKFPRHKQDGKRFDLVPTKQYDVEHPPSTWSGIASAYEYDSVWVSSDGITRVERLLGVPGPRDAAAAPVYHAVELSGSERLKRLLASGTPWSQTLTYAHASGEPVAAPTGAITVSLDLALRALKAAVGNPDDPAPTYGPIA